MKGTIKTLVSDKKFGFIAREGEAKDLFFHANDVSGASFDDLKVGDAVTFEVVQGQKGPNAKNVTRA
jgi:CspA family cold shock protein